MYAIITYNHPHRKTQDVLFRLKALGREVVVIAAPWQDRKNFVPLFKHRPDNAMDISIKDFCKNMRIVYHQADDLQATMDELKPKVSLIAGAGLLNITGHKIINSHPGYLPYVRGLDALKWAILGGKPIGVTTYVIGRELDEGDILDRKIVNLYPSDDFYTLATRVYETEVDMLVESIDKDPILIDDHYVGMPSRRMPHRLEMVMMRKFERLRDNI